MLVYLVAMYCLTQRCVYNIIHSIKYHNRDCPFCCYLQILSVQILYICLFVLFIVFYIT